MDREKLALLRTMRLEAEAARKRGKMEFAAAKSLERIIKTLRKKWKQP